jgi:hypothetical protein
MKHIKNFISLNESYQDGVELIDVIKNTPEGRDLQKIVLGHSFDTSFDLKRTGRVYLTNYGSKTSIERIANGRYSITSLSNGVPFWTEYYDSIPELIRGAWSNAVAKRISGSGMKKEDIRNWVLANIPIGSELSAVEILNSYTEKNSIEFLDANEIENTEIIRKLQSIFLNDDVIKIENQYRPPRAKLILDLGNTVFGNIFGFDTYGPNSTIKRTRGTIFLDIIPVSNDSKNSLKLEIRGGAVLKLKKSSDLNSDLKGFILKFIKLSVKRLTPYDFVGDKTELDIDGLIISAIEGGSVDTYQLIEDYLEKIGKLGDPSFPKAMNAISKSTDEKILELHKRLAEKYAATLRGIGIAGRFGAYGN